MSSYTELIINGVSMDLYSTETLPLSINKSVNDINGDTTGEYSKASIEIPVTKTNKEVLGNRGVYDVIILSNGTPKFKGKARVRRSKTISNKYGSVNSNYEINLISKNASWYTELGSSLLSDFVDIQITWNDSFVAAGTNVPNGTNDWVFGIIKWREWEVWNGTNYEIKWSEYTPGLLIKPIIENAFASIGYTVVSDFLDTDLGRKLSMPTPIPKKLSAEFNEQYLNTKVSLSAPYVSLFANTPENMPFDVIDVAAPENPTAYDNVTNFEYTCPLTGYYQIDFELTFDTTAPFTYTWIIDLIWSGGTIAPPVGWAFYNAGGYQLYPTDGLPLKATALLYCQAGDTFAPVIGNYEALYPLTITSGSMTITGEAVKTYGMPLDFKYLLKEWRFIDMMLGLKAYFNLVLDGDETTKVITIEPKDRYLERYKYPTQVQNSKEGYYKDEIKDYTDKVDYNKSGREDYLDTEGRFDFFLKLDNDPTAEFLLASSRLGIYEARYPISNSSNPQKTKPLEVPFFAATIHVSDIEAKFPDTNVVPQFPLIYPTNYIEDPTATEADQDYDIEPRLLYFGGRRTLLSDSIGDGFVEANGGFGIRHVPAWFAVNYNDTTGFDPSLSFSNEVGGSNTEIVGLLQSHHLTDTVRHEQGQIVEHYINLNAIDEHEFSFRIKGVVESQRYIVQLIENYNPLTNDSSNFKFYLDLSPTVTDVAKIINSKVKGIASLVVN